MPSRLQPILASLTLTSLLLATSAQADTRSDMAWREKLEAAPQQTWPVIQPAGDKYEYLLSAWRKGELWGVISEEQLQDPSHNRTAIPEARWLAKPVHDGVVLPKFRRTQGHLWLKPAGEARWHVFHTNGKKLTSLGATPYSDVRLLTGSDTLSLAELEAQLAEYPGLAGQYANVLRADLVLGLHAGHDAASSTVDLIDAGENRVLLTLSRLDLRQPPLLAGDLLLLRHDAAANAHTVIRLPPAPDGTYAALEVSASFRDLTLKGPVASALDDEGQAVLLDRDLRPFTVPGLALGRPEPLMPHLANADIFFKVPVLTDDGRAGYQFISRNKDGSPVLAPTLWQDIRLVRTYLIAQDMNDQWHLLRWKARDSGYDFTPTQLAGKPVVTDTLEAMDLAITEVNRADMQQLAASNRDAAARLAGWEAERAAQARKEAADRIELQRQIDEHAKARRAAEAEYQRLKEKSAADFAARNPSLGNWGNLSPLTLPSLRGAPGLSAMEKDYYDNRGNARNPYVLRERRP
jgi:hypothetical protein